VLDGNGFWNRLIDMTVFDTLHERNFRLLFPRHQDAVLLADGRQDVVYHIILAVLQIVFSVVVKEVFSGWVIKISIVKEKRLDKHGLVDCQIFNSLSSLNVVSLNVI
jgi:hypothetical protein